MVNLIIKDVLIQKKIILLYIPIIIILLLGSMSSPLYFGFIFSISFIMTSFSYDEKDNANILFNSLPYTRKEIVSSKYIGSLVFTLAFIFIIYSSNFLLNGKAIMFLWKEILLIIGLVMVAISFMFPISYKFKMKNLPIVASALVGILLLITTFFIPNLFGEIRELTQKFLTLQETQMYFVTILTIIILYIGSWLLSIRIYTRKAF
ncbi:ABC-2 type transport system permease protein [Lysinibacillus sp. RC46]|uniref:ABC-2 transporter permease n=1 Tax=Lysinibacillus sp. RC46 TaxID=3156295 RepID=UPI0035126623